MHVFAGAALQGVGTGWAQPDPAAMAPRIPVVDAVPEIEALAQGAVPSGALALQNFVQREPGDGIPISQTTDAWIAHDGSTLHVVFVCRDADPSAVRAHLARREAIATDDQVGILLDTFFDRRRAYLFLANPRGIQSDALLTDGQLDDFSFDAVWSVEAKLTADGYWVRFAIPFKSLRLPSANAQTWGIGLTRVIARANEQSFWPAVTRRVEGTVQQLARVELQDVAGGRDIEVVPYVALDQSGSRTVRRAPLEWSNKSTGGVDAKVVVRRAFALDLTVNPDFSQVESDQPQLTSNQRFELFFPEKRPFFLENAGYFQLGAVDLNRGASETLFFSRRIADPDGGGRLTGKWGRWTLGGLVANDAAPGKRAAPSDPDRDRHAGVGVLRVQRALGTSWNVGATGTAWSFADRENQVGAGDVRVRLTPALTLAGWCAVSRGAGDAGENAGLASNVHLKRAGRGAAVSLLYLDRSPAFQTELGFSPRRNVRLIEHYGEYRWRPSVSPVVAYGPNSFFRFEWDHDGTQRAWLLRFPFQLDMRGRTSFFVRHVESYDLVRGVGLRGRFDSFNASTEWWRWMTISQTLDYGTFPNFQTPVTRTPEAARGLIGTLDVQVRPTPASQFGLSYLYNGLRTHPDAEGIDGTAAIFDHHVARNARFVSVHPGAVAAHHRRLRRLPQQPRVSVDATTKRLGVDVLLTYLVRPGTACYIGYTDAFTGESRDGGCLARSHRAARLRQTEPTNALLKSVQCLSDERHALLDPRVARLEAHEVHTARSAVSLRVRAIPGDVMGACLPHSDIHAAHEATRDVAHRDVTAPARGIAKSSARGARVGFGRAARTRIEPFVRRVRPAFPPSSRAACFHCRARDRAPDLQHQHRMLCTFRRAVVHAVAGRVAEREAVGAVAGDRRGHVELYPSVRDGRDRCIQRCSGDRGAFL